MLCIVFLVHHGTIYSLSLVIRKHPRGLSAQALSLPGTERESKAKRRCTGREGGGMTCNNCGAWGKGVWESLLGAKLVGGTESDETTVSDEKTETHFVAGYKE